MLYEAAYTLKHPRGPAGSVGTNICHGGFVRLFPSPISVFSRQNHRFGALSGAEKHPAMAPREVQEAVVERRAAAPVAPGARAGARGTRGGRLHGAGTRNRRVSQLFASLLKAVGERVLAVDRLPGRRGARTGTMRAPAFSTALIQPLPPDSKTNPAPA